jgi:bifunctional UDP-N-acetylglucosamine pyrophosphorylase/glucosamine-1-phosphate N-acetyltransferase
MKKENSLKDALEHEGVRFLNKESTEIRGTLQCGKNVVIDSNVIFSGDVVLGDSVSVECNSVISNSVIRSGTIIKNNSTIKGSIVDENCTIGPYCRIRTGTKIDKQSQIGNFVEIKKSNIGMRCRINHMAFLGDAVLEDGVTIGAGVITCNNDGRNTHQTYIESNAFVGSNVNLVAPLRILKNSTIASGSTITEEVPENSLTIARSRQVSIGDWQGPKKQKK